MSADLIEVRVESGVATVALNRPEKRNALNDALRERLVEALEVLAADKSVKALVVTGNGKVFCAGGDVAAMAERIEAPAGEVGFNGWARQKHVHHALTLLHTFPVPTIAAVNGPSAGLGSDTAMACDFVIASEEASFAWSYIHRGLIADGGGMYLLPRRVGLVKAKELIFTGRAVNAHEAVQLGIADRVSPPATLLVDAQAWAAELGCGSRTALALGKSILNQSFELPAAQVFAQGSQAQAICYTSSEHRDSVMSFMAKVAARPAKPVGK